MNFIIQNHGTLIILNFRMINRNEYKHYRSGTKMVCKYHVIHIRALWKVSKKAKHQFLNYNVTLIVSMAVALMKA